MSLTLSFFLSGCFPLLYFKSSEKFVRAVLCFQYSICGDLTDSRNLQLWVLPVYFFFWAIWLPDVRRSQSKFTSFLTEMLCICTGKIGHSMWNYSAIIMGKNSLLGSIISKHSVSCMPYVALWQRFRQVPSGSSLGFFKSALSPGPLMLCEKPCQLLLHAQEPLSKTMLKTAGFTCWHQILYFIWQFKAIFNWQEHQVSKSVVELKVVCLLRIDFDLSISKCKIKI